MLERDQRRVAYIMHVTVAHRHSQCRCITGLNTQQTCLICRF